MVRLGRALNECKSKTEADTVAEVIVSQVCLRLFMPQLEMKMQLSVAVATVPSTAVSEYTSYRICANLLLCR